MIGSWWWLWMAFMFVLLVCPVGYGWGYRGWGAPYPSYIQRRRSESAAARGGPPGTFDHQAWGFGGDFIWIALFFGIVWVTTAFWWPVWYR